MAVTVTERLALLLEEVRSLESELAEWKQYFDTAVRDTKMEVYETLLHEVANSRDLITVELSIMRALALLKRGDGHEV